MKNVYARAMVFGVFDHFHKGHEYFLIQAQSQCDELVVVVTHPHIVELLKNQKPDHSLEQRINIIKKFNSTFLVVPGDTTIGAWTVFKEHNPDIVFLGYDQHGIAHELDKMNIPYESIDSHLPEKYKSSLFREK